MLLRHGSVHEGEDANQAILVKVIIGNNVGLHMEGRRVQVREYDFGGPDSRVFKPDIELSEKPTAFVKRQLFFTFEVEEEGGFRRVPEIGLTNFLWASDFPGLDSPWPHSKAMGHAPAEAALGKEALHQLVFDNAVNLYKIPVTLPQERART